MNQSVAVIGAGWAGLTCALEICAAGISVTLYEGNKTPGGRARRVMMPGGEVVDNGQHLLLGCYSETLKQIASVNENNSAAQLLHRLPLTLRMAQSMTAQPDISLQRPARSFFGNLMFVLAAKGLRLSEKLSLLRWLRKVRSGPSPHLNATVAEYCAELSPRVQQRIIFPLCLAALNTSAVNASAYVFYNVLRASFSGAKDSDMLLPAVDLSRLFPEPACKKLVQQGAQVRLGEPVIALEVLSGHIKITSRQGLAHYEHVVIATAPQHVADLLPPTERWAGLKSALDTLDYSPISTVYEPHYPRTPPWPRPMLTGLTHPQFQWVVHDAIDRLRSLVISGDEAHRDIDVEKLSLSAKKLLGPLAKVLTISEKQATYRCTPAHYLRLKSLAKPKVRFG